MIAAGPVGTEQYPPNVPRPSALDIANLVRRFFYDTALSPAATDMRSVLAAGQLQIERSNALRELPRLAQAIGS